MATIKIVILGIGIALVLAFVIGFGVDTFYKSPKWEDFCDRDMEIKYYETKETCEADNGKWMESENAVPTKLRQNELLCTKLSDNNNEISLSCRSNDDILGPTGNCDNSYYCRENFENAQKPHSRNSFIAIIILGLTAVIVGAYLKLTSVSAGIMGGGVLVMLYAAIRFWMDLDEYLRFGVLVVTLAVLIWIGYKKFMK